MSQAARRNPAWLVAHAGAIPALALSGVVAASASGQQPTPTPAGQPRISVPGGKPGANQPPTAPAPRDPSKAPPAGVDQSKVKVSDNMTVDIHVQGEEISNILEMLAIQSQKNIVTSKNVSGKIPSLNLYNVTFYEALDAILHVNGYGYVEQGNFIYVYTTQELIDLQKQLLKRSAKIIKLNYLSATDAAEFVKPMLGQGSEIKTLAKTEAFVVGDAPGGKDDSALSATIVVIDYEENIAAIEKLLAELDTRPAQVLIETTVLSTRLAEANAFGVDFSVIGSVNFTDFATATAGGPLGVANALINGSPLGFSPPDNAAVGGTSTVGNTKKAGGFKFAFISDPISVFVRALDEVGDTTTLANPKLLALNRQSTSIVVGQRIPYISTTQTDTSNTQTVQFLDTGVQLFFRPFVLNNGQVRMEVRPQLSDAEIIQVRGPSGVVDAPRENKQQITTNVIVPDGATVVIGGLFRETTVASRSQVPGIGNIPVIGEAFKGHDDSLIREEIIFCVTPTIVNDSSLLAQGEQEKNWIERVRAGSRQQLLPFSRERMTATLNVDAERAAQQGDYARAENLLERSLSLNPNQPTAIALRERVTGQKEIWPSGQRLNGVVSNEVDRAFTTLPVPANPPERGRAYMHVMLPTQPLVPTPGEAPAPGAAGSNPNAPSKDGRTSEPNSSNPPTNSDTDAAASSNSTNTPAPANTDPATGWRVSQNVNSPQPEGQVQWVDVNGQKQNAEASNFSNTSGNTNTNPNNFNGSTDSHNSGSSDTFNNTKSTGDAATSGNGSNTQSNADSGIFGNATYRFNDGSTMTSTGAASFQADASIAGNPSATSAVPGSPMLGNGLSFILDPFFDAADEPMPFWTGPWYKGFAFTPWTPMTQSRVPSAPASPFVTAPTDQQK